MNFNDYQKEALKTAVFPPSEALAYLSLGLVGEAGEVANKIKKVIRGDYDDDPWAFEQAMDKAGAELGDIIWYIAVLADELGLSLSDVAIDNLAKLNMRETNGTLKGSGDDR